MTWHFGGYDDTCEYVDDSIFAWDQSWGCHSDDTEVLTDKGWKKFSDLDKTEKVYTLNPDNWEIELHKPSHYHEYDVDTELYHYKNRGIDCLVTSNHNMYVSRHKYQRKITDFSLIQQDKLKKKYFSFKKDGVWKGAHILEHTMHSGRKIDMNLWLEFLGYIISEGWATKTKKRCKILANGEEETQYGHSVNICQLKTENFDKIENCLDKLPFKFTRYDDSWTSYGKELYEELKFLGKCHEKYIPDYVWDCSKEQLRILFDALILGDGNVRGDSKCYYTSSKRLADDFSRLCLHVGYAGDIHIVDRVGQMNGLGGRRNHIEYIVRRNK